MYLPKINVIERSEIVTDTFGGYINRLKVGDGYWNRTGGTTLDEYPLAASRAPRGKLEELEEPQALLGKGALAWVSKGTLYYNRMPVTLPGGVMLDSEGEKQLIGMGAYICIFPDKVYWNTQDGTDAGYMEAHWSTEIAEGSNVQYKPCRMDGSVYEDVYIGDAEPEEPESGDYWLDTSEDSHTLKVYQGYTSTWVSIPTVFTRIECAGIGKQFSQYDGVEISGAEYSGMLESMPEQVAGINGTKLIYAKGDDWIVVQALIDAAFEQTTGTIKVDRNVPDMDFVVESENRLWGCKYGLVNGMTVNELYACKLGDFKNWRCYAGVSTDSYAVSLGSDGVFTGAITYQGSPHFFKENAIHKVYGNLPSNYQVVTSDVRGVQKGSAKSLAIVSGTLYYKSPVDIVEYDGSAPNGISDALGSVRYSNAVAGAWNGRYVISMDRADGEPELFVYYPRLSMWMRDSSTRLQYAAHIGEELYTIDAADRLWCMSGAEGEPEEEIEWEYETGLQGWEYVRKKYVSRYNIRLKMAEGATAEAFLQYDSNGVWKSAAKLTGNGKTGTQHMFVIPRRCDHLKMRIAGKGRVEILSISRILEQASDL